MTSRCNRVPGVECTTRTVEIPEPRCAMGTTAAGLPSVSRTQ
jgi:hypothetical protein